MRHSGLLNYREFFMKLLRICILIKLEKQHD